MFCYVLSLKTVGNKAFLEDLTSKTLLLGLFSRGKLNFLDRIYLIYNLRIDKLHLCQVHTFSTLFCFLKIS